MQTDTKRGDTAPLPRYQLFGADRQPVSLVGAVVVQRFAGAPVAGSPCTIDGDPVDGIVRLASRDHLPDPGTRSFVKIDYETEVTFGGGEVQTFPTAGYDTWAVWADLDDKAEV